MLEFGKFKIINLSIWKINTLLFEKLLKIWKFRNITRPTFRRFKF